jgi:hypothetical protein
MKFNTMTGDGDGRSVGERVLDDFLINLGSRDKILTNVSQAGEMIGYRSCKKPAKNCVSEISVGPFLVIQCLSS